MSDQALLLPSWLTRWAGSSSERKFDMKSNRMVLFFILMFVLLTLVGHADQIVISNYGLGQSFDPTYYFISISGLYGSERYNAVTFTPQSSFYFGGAELPLSLNVNDGNPGVGLNSVTLALITNLSLDVLPLVPPVTLEKITLNGVLPEYDPAIIDFESTSHTLLQQGVQYWLVLMTNGSGPTATTEVRWYGNSIGQEGLNVAYYSNYPTPEWHDNGILAPYPSPAFEVYGNSQTVPEPATFLLFFTGLGVLGLMAWRRGN